MYLSLSDTNLTLLPITDEDMEILYMLYAGTRDEEMKLLPNWTLEQKGIFLRQQFTAQHTYYQQQFGNADFWMINKNGKAIGRLYLNKKNERGSVHIIDITLLPEWRNRGIGKQLLLDIARFAGENDRSVTIRVEAFNRAMHFYKRLGFEFVEVTNSVYHLMEWKQKKGITVDA